MSPDKVVGLIGEEQTYEDWMGGNLNDSLLYHHLIIGFDKYDASGPLPEGRLSEMQMRSREDITLWGNQSKILGVLNPGHLCKKKEERSLPPWA